MVLYVFIFLLLSGNCAGSIEDEQHVITELSDIETQLKLVDSGLHKTADTVYRLKSELSGKTSDQEQRGELVPLRSCIRPQEAWRVELGDELKLTMKYLELADDVTVRWTDTVKTFQATYLELSNKVMESSVILPNYFTSDAMIFLSAFCEDKQHLVNYQFRVQGFKSSHQTFSEDTMPVVALNTTGDIVYDIGQDAVFKIRINMRENPGGLDLHTEVMASLVDLQTGQFEMGTLSSYKNKSVEFLESKMDVNSSEATVIMKMSERMKSGNIMISFYKILNGNVVLVISEFFNVFIRPSNQSGPFPPGYISIKEPLYKQFDENGELKVPCRVNSVCHITCEAIGDAVEKVEFLQMNPDGTRVALSPDTQIFNNGLDSNYSKSNTIFVEADDNVDTAGVKYVCLATNQQGKQATKYFVIESYIPLKIIEEKSSIITGNDQLNLTCTVTGLPEPTVTFQVSTSGGQWYYSYNPDTTTRLGNNTYLATMSADFDRSSMGQLLSGSCTAKGEEGANYESYDHYNFEIPQQ